MSRIGNMPIIVPEGVTVTLDGQNILVNGVLGELSMVAASEISVEMVEQQILVKRRKETQTARALHGLTRTLVSNMVVGVAKGWEKKLELVGVGYRAQTSGEKITLNVGFSHPVEISAPTGIKFAVADNTKITVTGFDKHLVGQIAAAIRSTKPPEPYQGKGIRYQGEYVRRKAGKAGKVGAGAAK